jgi:hypothetical protein
MKRFAVVGCLAILFLSVAVWAAKKQADFNGTWHQNVLLSDAEPKYSSSGSNMGGMGGGMGGMGGGMGGMGGGMSRGGGMSGGMGGGMGRGGGMSGGMGGGMGRGGGMGGGMGRSGGMGGGMGRGGGMGMPGGIGRGALQGYKTLVIAQTADEIKITNKDAVNGQDLVETIKADGKERAELVDADSFGGGKMQVKQTAKAQLTKDKLTVTATTGTQAAKPLTRKREFALSKDGKTITLKVTNSGAVSSTQKLVFNKE